MQSFYKTPDRKNRGILILGDEAALALSLALAFYIQMLSTGRVENFLDPIRSLSFASRVVAVGNLCLLFVGIVLLFSLLYMILYYVGGLYEVEQAFDRKRTAVRLMIGVGSGIGLASAIAGLLPWFTFPWTFWPLHAALLFATVLTWRLIFSRLVAYRSPLEVIFIGEDRLCREAVAHIRSNGARQFFRFTNVSRTDFFSAGRSVPEPGGGGGRMIVYPFRESLSAEELHGLLQKKFDGVSICSSLNFFKISTCRYPVRELDPGWLIDLSISLHLKGQGQQRIKRLVDVGVSLAGLVVTLPLLLLIAALVKATSSGPILFSHERLGLNEKPFRLHKFRTMVAGAERKSGPVWAAPDDPRVTPVGRFLRKSRLDELPQFVNILKGEMSLIGPRPIRRFFADQLAERSPYYRLRFCVKPGLTGWAQVMGGYGDSVEGQMRKLEYDLFYIHEYSLLMDGEIFLRTIKRVFAAEGQ